MSTEQLADRFRNRFPVKMDGKSGTFVWERGDREPVGPYEPAKGSRSGRRCDGVSICMIAYHAALGDQVSLKTIVAGKHRTYVLNIKPEEARAYLELHAHATGFDLLKGVAQQWLTALDKAQEVQPGS